jgi:hypothetical protein
VYYRTIQLYTDGTSGNGEYFRKSILYYENGLPKLEDVEHSIVKTLGLHNDILNFPYEIPPYKRRYDLIDVWDSTPGQEGNRMLVAITQAKIDGAPDRASVELQNGDNEAGCPRLGTPKDEIPKK